MAETQSGNRVKGGVLLFGLALAAILAAIGYRSLSTDSISADDAELGTPLDRLEERVAETPDDGAAWQELGFLRFEQGEYGAAAAAYRKAAEIDPGEAVLWSALGEALVMDSKRDPLPPEALAAFERAVEIDADDLHILRSPRWICLVDTALVGRRCVINEAAYHCLPVRL